MKYVIALITLGIVTVEVVLWQSGIISGPMAFLSILSAELLLLVSVILLVWRRSRRTGVPLTTLMPPLRMLLLEARMFIDLYRLVRRDVRVPEHATALSSTSGLWTLPLALTIATVIEIIAIELILPWPAVRIILAVLSVYSLLWLWAIFGQRVVYPHYLTKDALVLRCGRTVVARLTDIETITSERGFDSDSHNIAEGVLILASGEGTNITVRCQPSPALPFHWPWQNPSPESVSQVRLWVDDPYLLLDGGPAERTLGEN